MNNRSRSVAATFRKSRKVGKPLLVSKFLQHCAPERFEPARWWDIEKISAEIEPVLAEFEKRFSAPVKRTEVQLWLGLVRVRSRYDHHQEGAVLLGPKE
jgi:hypothetical protein